MSIRTLIRITSVALGLALASPLVPPLAGPRAPSGAGLAFILAALGAVGLSLGYLVLLAGGDDLTRWQLRYHLQGGDSLEHLEEILRFLADRTGHVVLEAGARGLFLELPVAFDRYLEAQLPRALAEVKLARAGGDEDRHTGGSFFLYTGSLHSDLLHRATEDHGLTVRLHLHHGPHATLVARTEGARPPGRWFRLPLPRLLGRVWHHCPVWDELSGGVRLSGLFPPADEAAAYSSRSRLLRLLPPDDYAPAPAGRTLGLSADGRRLTSSHTTPLYTMGAPSSFLVRQAVDDLQAGRSVVVLSPQRRILERIEKGAGGIPAHWLDPQNLRRSAHLSIVSAGEWQTVEIETVVHQVPAFLADLGVNVHLPTVASFAGQLNQALAISARDTGQAFAFTDLFQISQSTQALRSFLTRTQSVTAGIGSELLAQLDSDMGYVQAVTVLSTLRAALKPLESGPLHSLCQPPFLDARQVLGEASLLLVPMTNDDFPKHDHLLSSMLDLVLSRVLAGEENLSLALHLHDPHLYRADGGRRWMDLARNEQRLSLLLDVQQPNRYEPREGSQIVFRCSEALASILIDEWNLPACPSDLAELPPGAAVARLSGMVVTLKVDAE